MTVRVRRNTPGLDHLTKLLSEINGRWVAEPPVSEDSIQKLSALKKTGRDFLKATPALRQSMVRFAVAKLKRSGNVSSRELLDAAADGARAQVLLRFKYSGNDVSLKPLTAKYIAMKIAKGLDRRVGTATHKLLNELSGKWTVRK